MQYNKEIIKHRFENASGSYDSEAVIQRVMADKLYQNLLLVNNSFDDIFEIGCGTGLFTGKIIDFSFNRLLLNDLSCFIKDSNILSLMGNKVSFVQGDAENGVFLEKFDLICSNAVFQWFNDILSFVDKIVSNLKQNGVVAFSTFCEKNMEQVKSITGKGLKYLTFEEISIYLKARYKIIHSSYDIHHLKFKKPIDVLKHIKLTGANGTNDEVWCRGDLKRFNDLYENFKDGESYLLTYHPAYFILSNN